MGKMIDFLKAYFRAWREERKILAAYKKRTAKLYPKRK